MAPSIKRPADGFSGVAGQQRTFTLSAIGQSPGQQPSYQASQPSGTFTYTLSWGDGSTDTIGPGAASVDTDSHAYATPGTYTITLTVTDPFGTTSAPVTNTATILPYELQGSTLAIGGTTSNNSFVLAAGARAGSLTAQENGATLGVFHASAATIYGDGGTNQVTIVGATSAADTFTLGGNTATFTSAGAASLFTIGLDNISQVTFQGGNRANSFTTTGSTVPALLLGGAGANRYTMAGTQTGAATIIRGSGKANTLYGPTLAGAAANLWTITGGNTGTLDGAISFTGVQNLVGGAGANTLTAPNLANTVAITAHNAGTLSISTGAVHFTSMQNLVGGTLSNTFVFSRGAGVSGTITGHGVSRLDYSAYRAAVSVNLVLGTATGTGGVAQIAQVHGSGKGDVLVGNGSGELLVETSGQNLLIAGPGAGATIDSGSGADLVIAGSANYDNNPAALAAIEAYWAAHVLKSHAATVAALSAGIAGGYKLVATSVKHQDTGDTLVLGSARDWIFCRLAGNTKDSVKGSAGNSTII
jgi:PKD repeat protein